MADTPQAPAATPEAKKNWFVRHKVLSVILALILIAIIVRVASGGGNGGDGDTGSTETQASDEAEVVGLNQPARDGAFEFTVTGIECGRTRVGSDDFGKDAQGQFCFLTVLVKNVGDEPGNMFADNQKLFDNQNREFAADSEAQIYADEAKTIFEEINPGNTLEGVIIFDVPKDVTPVKAELHDSAFSGGVIVNLV